MKKIVSEFGTTLLGLCVMFLYVTGCMHSQNKHPEEPDFVRYSPFAVYRGVEKYWHNDYAGVNWEEKIKDDVNTAVELISASSGTYKIDDIKKQTDELGDKIKKYPKNKQLDIKMGVDKYLKLLKAISVDMGYFLKNFAEDSIFHMSDKTKSIYDSLKGYYNIPGIDVFKTVYDSFSHKISNDTASIEIYAKRLKEHEDYDYEFYDKAYYKIFGEHIKQ